MRTSLRTAEKGQAITARLIVRRVRDQNAKAAGTGELSPSGAATPSSPAALSSCSRPKPSTRDHAIAGQLLADWTGCPMARLPAGHFAASASTTA